MGQRRKHVLQSAFSQDIQPPAESQQIVRAVGARGGNIIEVEYPNGSTTLCMMPAKFNRKLWVRRGGYLVIEPSPEAEQDANSRVTGTICAVLYDEHMKQLKKMPGVWPSEFTTVVPAATASTANGVMPPSATDSSEAADEAEAGSTAAHGQQLESTCQQQFLLQQQQQQPDSSSRPTGSVAPVEVVEPAAELVASGLENRGLRKASISGEEHLVVNDMHQLDPQVDHQVDCGDESSGSSGEENDGLPPLQQINNRRVLQYEASEDSDSEDDA